MTMLKYVNTKFKIGTHWWYPNFVTKDNDRPEVMEVVVTGQSWMGERSGVYYVETTRVGLGHGVSRPADRLYKTREEAVAYLRSKILIKIGDLEAQLSKLS